MHSTVRFKGGKKNCKYVEILEGQMREGQLVIPRNVDSHKIFREWLVKLVHFMGGVHNNIMLCIGLPLRSDSMF